jgi:transmembrane sensor
MEQFDDLFDVSRLISSYLRDDLTEKEQQGLQDWLDARPENRKQFERLTAEAKLKSNYIVYGQTDKTSAWARIVEETGYHKRKKSFVINLRIATAAASILIFLSVGSYFYFNRTQPVQMAAIKPGTFKNDALPGNKAILTLANGQKIVVNEAKNGTIAQQGTTNISKTANGNIVYAPGSKDAVIAYNTYTIPRGGGKHSLVLADGTLAVLDAGSSIRYPTTFTGKDRKVEVSGQVYFEVVHNSAQPFFVTAKGQTIEDIGTHFNINAFDDEPGVKTTLLEGSIKIAGILLKPGQQAVQSNNGKLSILDNVNTEEVVAWKNDLFMFTNNTTLPVVMKQLSRWYDLEVLYQGKGQVYHFGGDMPRNSKLSEVLRILAYSGVQFSIDGKKIIVYQ